MKDSIFAKERENYCVSKGNSFSLGETNTLVYLIFRFTIIKLLFIDRSLMIDHKTFFLRCYNVIITL